MPTGAAGNRGGDEAHARDLEPGGLRLTIKTAMAPRQRRLFSTPEGRLLSSEGGMAVETANGVAYILHFGHVVTGGAGNNRCLFITASYDAARAARYGGASGAGERLAREITKRFADWYHVISNADLTR